MTPDELRKWAESLRWKVVYDNQTLARIFDEAAYALELAIAHDRQPYPTAAAYEAVCAALEDKRKRLEEAECPDVPTARALAVLIMTNKVPSPWRDTGTRLREIGKWLATIAGRPAQQVAEADAPVCPFCGSDHSGQFCPLAGEETT